MKEKEFNSWSKSRRKGKLKFILINGVLAWGMPMFFLMTFMLNDAFDESGLIMSHVRINAVIWTITGLFFGISVWFFSEYKYKKEVANRKEPEQIN